jgi:TetR/AcrR family transcriptional repressor of nem operon
MAGRPKHFDESKTLEQAMELFWVKGYDCTGISDLEKTLGIGRQSIYNTFGDKRSLFLKAFNHYAQTRSGAMVALLKDAGTAQQRIDRFLTALIEAQCSDKRSGCLLANSVSSSIQSDPEAAAIVDSSLKRLHKALSDTLKETTPDASERKKTAWLLVNTAQGLCVLSKSGQPKNTLTGIKTQILALIFKPDFSTP